MSFLDCLAKSKISDAKRKEAENIYTERYKEYEREGMTRQDADAAAAKDTADALDIQKALEKKRKLKIIQSQQNIQEALSSYKDGKGRDNYANAALALFERDEFSKYPSLVGRESVIKGQAHALMSDVLQKFQPKVSGLVRPKAGLDNIVREMFGEGTGDGAASELAKAVSEAFEMLRLRANRAGANIGKKDNYGMPQTHDRVRVSKVSQQDWVDYVLPRLDWDKMKDPNTGLSIPPLKRQSVLQNVYDTIKTDGYSKLKAGEARRLGALDKRLANHRFLEFKDGSNWLEYHNKFGVGTPFDVMVNHIERMSRNVASMEILGVNPNTGKEYIKQLVMQNAAEIDVSDTGAKKSLKTKNIEKKLDTLDDMYAVHMNTNGAASEDAVALTFASIRNTLTSAFLGSASLLAVTGDFFTKRMTQAFNKHPANIATSQYIKLLASKENQGVAIRAGLIAESATSIAYGQQRFLGEITGSEFTQRLTDVVMRASFMTPHTQAARWSFGMETLGMFNDFSMKPFDELPFKGSMSRYGITANDWEVFKATKPYEHKGGKFIRPDDLRVREDLDPQQAQDLADKFMEYVFGEMEFAVPSSSLRARTALISSSRGGTLSGEIARSFAMFKNFPITVIFTHIRRGLTQEKTRDKLAYLAAFGLGMTAMGAMGLQMRQISQGKDPLSMNPSDPNGQKFWANAALAGGGLAIWGDFLFSDVNRYGGGLEQTVAGAVPSFLNDVRKIGIGSALKKAQQEDVNLAADLNNFASKYTPGKSIWYLRAALQRAVFDQIALEVDPKAARRFAQMEKKLQTEKGQEYFWKPAELSPERAPDFAAAVE